MAAFSGLSTKMERLCSIAHKPADLYSQCKRKKFPEFFFLKDKVKIKF
jgi:hypothetical protein